MATRDEINDEFYAGYGDQPRAMTLMDYLTPSSYIDPYKSLRNPPLEMDEKGFRQLSQTEANKVYNDPRYDPNLSANAQYDKLYGQTNANKFSMPDLTNYIPSPSSITKYIPTELPNVFGVNNPMYAGLLGADQAQALSKQSNVAGLLGGLASLATGLGRQGPRRSAFQNIISALGAGYGSAGQAYQQGLQTYSQAQQLALLQRQQAGIQAMKNKYPDLADEFDTNPAGAFRIVAEREAAAKKPTVVGQGGTLVDPTGKVLFAAPSETKPEKGETFSGEYANVALNLFGTADVSKLNPEQRAAVASEAQRRGIEKTPKTTVNVSPADKKFSEQFGAATAGAVESTFNKAQSAQNTLSTIATIKPLIKDNVFAGPLSSSEATISRIGEKFGITSGTTQEKLNRTTQAMQGLAQLELQAAEAMKGQGAITDFERTLIARAAGGDLTKLTQKEVLGLLGALEKVAQKKISTHKTNLERLRKRPDTSGLADFYELEAPTPRLKFDPATGRVQ